MFIITSRELQCITPIVAASLLEKNTYVSQRALSKQHVKNLCNAIRKGEFHTGEIVLATAGDGKEHILNGQHQLNAVVMAGAPINVLMVRAECPTPEDMSNLFSQFDVNKGRSILDIVKSEVNSIDGVCWNHLTGSLLAGALAIIDNESKGETRHEKALRIRTFTAEGNFVNQFIGTANKHLNRAQVVACMISTYWKAPTAAYEFWNYVGSGEMLARKDPRMTLRTYLVSLSIKGNGSIGTRKEIMAKCVIAWNAFRMDKPTSLKYSADKPVPKVI
jgi:hypothetical protein